jgi:hypothetical protein
MIKGRHEPTIPKVQRPNAMCALDRRGDSAYLKIGVLTGLVITHGYVACNVVTKEPTLNASVIL